MPQGFLDVLRGKLSFTSRELAFCTHYSWFGVAKKDRLGIEELFLFYNRRPALLSPNFLTFRTDGPEAGSERQKSRADLPLSIEETNGHGFAGTTAFADSDILCYHLSLAASSRADGLRGTLLLPETEPRLSRRVTFDETTRLLKMDARMPATDARDPDPDHAITICLKVPEAFTITMVLADGEDVSRSVQDAVETDGPLAMTFHATREEIGSGEHTFVVGIGEGPSADKIEARMATHPHVTSARSGAASLNWLSQALDKFSFDGVPRNLRLPYARSVYQILSNTKAPRGLISRPAAFPSRGVYCSHYLWDACFTNLGVAQFNQGLAEDFLIALCENQEPDGKIPQFVCATWNRPGESQPPLIAWSAWRLYEEFGNRGLLEQVYEPVGRMIDWWFAGRDGDGDGLVEYQHPLESGWDNSPRFDKGRIAGVDLNAYLNREMRILGKMAAVLERKSESDVWEARAGEHARLIYARLYDPEDGLFYDRLVKEDRLHKVLTPASFMPLWAGVKVPGDGAQRMIAQYLANPRHFFGARPFPVVAYSDPNYSPEKWWRGPVWPNIAWAMTEILRDYGFEAEYREAVRRLVDMMARPDEMNELYSSATGQPLGAEGLCWGCAVFMALAKGSG